MAERHQLGDKETRSCLCKSYKGLPDVDEMVFRPHEDACWKVRNFEILNLFYQPPNVRKFWEEHRKTEIFLGVIVPIVTQAPFFLVSLLDFSHAQGVYEKVLFVFGLSNILSFLPLNVDNLLYRMRHGFPLLDFVLTLSAVVLLILYGQGFIYIGSWGLVVCWYFRIVYYPLLMHYYFNLDTSYRQLVINLNKMALVGVVITILFGRGLIFFQKWTVVDDTAITFDGRIVTIRDIWISLVDVLYGRALFAAFDMFVGFRLDNINAYEVGVRASDDVPVTYNP
uniref:Uncharacterized protein n=1 Tax=Aplanochytrium stocchinoi TaxID=215587 RepID=A0A7S3PFU3_9STRA|mmetsp:Transcript_18948/g.23093  ORF Transcript_18948/g.23093 Transcript_18948/m.23093 type:complete len:282 (+) Transcript_18948:252-1097(+)